MYLLISQETICRYSNPVRLARLEHRVFPVTSPEQEILRFGAQIRPEGRCLESNDAWGNRMRVIVWDAPIDSWKLSISIFANTVRENPFDFPPDAADRPVPSNADEFPPETRAYLKWSKDPLDGIPAVTEWARHLTASIPGAFGKIQAVMTWIHREFEFRKGQTDIKTTPDEVLRLRRGVCQDFATLLICATRSLGLPARYVSGYVYEGPCANRRDPAPTGHGWAEVYFPNVGWRGFDALNGILACGTHVRVAHGRWFADCAPVIGRLPGPAIGQTTETRISVDRADASGRNAE